MKAVIIGDGKVGYALAEHLLAEGHDLTVIDKSDGALLRASENLDVMTVKGNGASSHIMKEAGIADADLLISVTNNDELNMVCCLLGKNLGAKHTVARIRDPLYSVDTELLKNQLNIDMVINPEQIAAHEISRLVRFPSAIDIEGFARGRVEMVEYIIDENDDAIGIPLSTLAPKLPVRLLFGAVERAGTLIIPNGDFSFLDGDRVYVLGEPPKIARFFRHIGKYKSKPKNVLIVGGGFTSIYLAKLLSKEDIHVKIIELNYAKCFELSAQLPDALIIHGDGTDPNVLKAENLEKAGAYIALTDRDEENLFTSMYAMQMGVPKVITKTNRLNYPQIIKKLGIDSIVSPKTITANAIMRFVRAKQQRQGSVMERLYKIIDGKAEAIEFTADTVQGLTNVPLKDLALKKGVLIGVLVRKGQVIIPDGNDHIEKGDSVIIITNHLGMIDISSILT